MPKPGAPNLSLICVAIGLAINAGELRGQQDQRNGFGFSANLGWSTIGGEYGELLEWGVPGEGALWYQPSWWRVGAYIHVTSFGVVEPVDALSVSQINFGLFGAFTLLRGRLVQPYVQVRVGATRWRPEGPLFDPNPPPPDVPPGENPAPRRTGFQGGLGAGVEFWITKNFAFDVSGFVSGFSTEALDVPILGITGLKSGSETGFKGGVKWFP